MISTKLWMSERFLSIEELEKKMMFNSNEEEFKIKRTKTQILVIDNERPKIIDTLLGLGYNVQHLKDITNISDIKDYHDIFIVDVLGVGKKLSEESEGAYLASVIKKDNIFKPVYIFTGSNQDKKYNPYYNELDGVYAKNQSEELINQIENYVRNTHSIINKWYKYKAQLYTLKCSVNTIAFFEHYYVLSCYKRKSHIFSRAVDYFFAKKVKESDEIRKLMKYASEFVVKNVV